MAAHAGHLTGPRLLLRQIRSIMARPGSAQERLDQLVDRIAANMVADVCSIYLRRDSGQMELWATHGLSGDAVHVTRLEANEGLIGEIARTTKPLYLSEAHKHPKFSYHPETGEKPFHAFLGVPILHGGRLLGVLVVQNRMPRIYSEEETEALQNVAMVLAGIVSAGDLFDAQELHTVALRPMREEQGHGKVIAEGLTYGTAVIHEPQVARASLIAEDPEAEEKRLEKAILEMRQAIDTFFQGKGHLLGGPSRDVIEAYRMFAHDQAWVERLYAAAASGLSAEAAVERVRGEHRARLQNARDPYMRERLHDLEDLANRLLRHLGAIDAPADLPARAVLVARDIGPAELLEFDRKKLKGLILENGSPTSHAAIVARALRLPVVGQIKGAMDRINPGDTLLVDAETGTVDIRPAPENINSFEQRLGVRHQRRAVFARQRDVPARTLDGQNIDLFMNAGLQVDLPRLDETGAQGIGLFRTEFQFMLSDHLPRLDAQIALYSSVLEAAKGRPVVFRTLDLGGDKVLPYVAHEREGNPALGWRAMRMALDRPSLLRFQLRALIAAANGRPLNVMFPLITTVAEFRSGRDLLDKEVERARRFGRAVPETINLGSMVETPAIVWQLDELLAEAGFVSVGANDLLQYFFAADRDNDRVSERYDMLNAGALRMLRHIAKTCAKAERPASVCGEIAGHALEAATLIALGFTQLSVPPAAVGPVKRMILTLPAQKLGTALARWIDQGAPDIRRKVAAFAKTHAIRV